MLDPLLIATLIAIIICLIGLSWFAGSDAPFIPTKMTKMLQVLKAAGVKKGKIFYELGSGDGRVVMAAARLGADAHGVEQSWIRVWYSRYQAWQLKPQLRIGSASFYHGNIFDRQYYPADFVYIFLLPKGVEKLEQKLKKELQAGSIVITQTFHFKRWKPFKKIDLTQGQRSITKDGKKIGDFWVYKV